jgi:hypothetical protein
MILTARYQIQAFRMARALYVSLNHSLGFRGSVE